MALQFGPPEPSYRGQATRRRILDALYDLLRTFPAAQVSVADVAERAGMKRSSVYNHFRTVDEMCLALIDRTAVAVFDNSHLENAPDLAAYMTHAFMSVFRMWALHHVVFVMALELYARDRAFARAWEERVSQKWTEKALLVYQADVAAGRLAPVPDPKGMLNHLALSAQHQFHRLWMHGVPTTQDSYREVELCFTVIWRALGLPGRPAVDRGRVDEALAWAAM